jgi:uncharacterized SAM-binding protein YcdF (DUF218 family)
MYLMKQLILNLILPPAGPLLIAIGSIFLVRYRPRLGKFLAGAALSSLLLLSTSWVAGSLLASLQQFPAITEQQLNTCQAIVVLGGGMYRRAPEYGGDTIGYTSLERLRYAIRLSKRSGLPILATGGAPEGGMAEAEAMARSAQEDFSTKIRWIEGASLNTADNARMSAAMLKRNGIERIALVTHAWHLRRAVTLFEAAGLSVVPAPTAFSTQPSDFSVFIPNAAALAASRQALHEWLGILAEKFNDFRNREAIR